MATNHLETWLEQELNQLMHRLVAPLQTRVTGESPHEPTNDLERELQLELRKLVSDWKRQKTMELVEWATVALACMAEDLAAESFLPESEQSSVLPSPETASRRGAPGQNKLQPQHGFQELLPAAGSGSRSGNALDEQRLDGGLDRKLQQRQATITVTEFERFLKRIGYQRVPSKNGDQAWRGTTGAVLSLPRSRGDLARPTQAKLLKQLSEQIGRDVRVVRGHMQFVDESTLVSSGR